MNKSEHPISGLLVRIVRKLVELRVANEVTMDTAFELEICR